MVMKLVPKPTKAISHASMSPVVVLEGQSAPSENGVMMVRIITSVIG